MLRDAKLVRAGLGGLNFIVPRFLRALRCDFPFVDVGANQRFLFLIEVANGQQLAPDVVALLGDGFFFWFGFGDSSVELGLNSLIVGGIENGLLEFLLLGNLRL